MYKHWTNAEEKRLLQLYSVINIRSVAEVLGRTYDSTKTRLKRLRERNGK